jgi:hypothetical protein
MLIKLTNHTLLFAVPDDQKLTNVCLKFGLPPQNLQFTGQTKELQLLSDIVEGAGKGQRKIAVLHGLGCIGKTNIVIQYAWQNLVIYTSVWWIHSAHSTADWLW